MSMASDYYEPLMWALENCGADVAKRFFEPCGECIACLKSELTKVKGALVAVGIERDHHKKTVKTVIHSGLCVNTQERGIKDMCGVDIEF